HADPRTPNIWEALVAIRSTQGNEIALISEEGKASTFAELEGYVNHSAQLLRDWGIDIKDRVALVTDNGPHAVAAFLALFRVCACFPQNPAASYEECLKYMEDGRVSAVLHKEGLDSDLISAARTLKVPVIFFSADESLPGFISIASPEIASSDMRSIPSGSDTALILQTSGTTSRPKVVPFSHERLIGTALSFAASLELSVNDRTVNVTPLFHGYGLNTVVLATLFSGGAVVCCKGFATEKFLEILETMEVTWFSAVPTILQAIAQDLPQGGINHRLRFIRSGSASLPFTVAEELERVLAVPVIEAYATTETVLISSNPVSMNRRKRGSAGIPRECEVEIRNSEGSPTVSPQRGEIWVRGPLVMKGYEND
ncbi:MAG TPA: AMP-binding protein, partial [Synergistales bacterium]|nr:AMP-binding protein [Synergistales bacterium]